MPNANLPFFSIIITTYNREKLIIRALESLMAQEEKDWEAIIIDDGSQDQTELIVQNFIKDQNRFRYFKQDNQGAEAARNKGIALSKGKYISFLDSDDEYLPQHLSGRKRILIQDTTIDLLHGGVKIIGNAFVPDRNQPGKQIHLDDCVIGGTFFIKRLLWNALKKFKLIPMGSDADFFERAEKLNAHIVKTSLPTYVYHREHSDSITKNFVE